MTPTPRLQAAEHGQLLLSGELTLDTVSALATDTRVLFADDGDINIDLGAVARADSAGVALLVQWQREARRRQRTVCFRNIPSQMLSIARLCGVDELLALS
ncbi:MAG: STAS domain-containing protein [Gammaproteobacteria bacterium]|nr:STAS domain-containing protein [Gammaproteobacteria bacterium]